MGFWETNSSTIIFIVASIAFAIIFHLMRKKKNPKRRLLKDEISMSADETELRSLLEKKKAAVRAAKEFIHKEPEKTHKKLEEMHATVNEQSKILHDMTKIDERDLSYLKHIKITIPEEGKGDVQLSSFIHHIEKKWGDFDPATIEKKVEEVQHESDAIKSGALSLALTLVYLHKQFESIMNLLMDQVENKVKVQKEIERVIKGKLKKNENLHTTLDALVKMLTELVSKIQKESEDLDDIYMHTHRLRKYTQQLPSPSNNPPFLLVLEHPVDIIGPSGSTTTFGKGEEISLGNRAESFAMGKDAHQCMLVLNKGPDTQGLFVRKGKVCYFKTGAGTSDVSVKRARGTLFADKPVRLKHRDELVFGSGYRFRFLEH